MTNILALPQLPAWQLTCSVDGDWVDPTIFFPADSVGTPPNNPLDLTGIRFYVTFKRPSDSQIMLILDTADGSLVNYGVLGYLAPYALVASRPPLYPATCLGSMFATADGYTRNLSEANGPLTFVIQDD